MCSDCLLPLNALSNISASVHLFLALAYTAVRFERAWDEAVLGIKFTVIHIGTVLVADERRADYPENSAS